MKMLSVCGCSCVIFAVQLKIGYNCKIQNLNRPIKIKLFLMTYVDVSLNNTDKYLKAKLLRSEPRR